jgi:hypothetical protein
MHMHLVMFQVLDRQAFDDGHGSRGVPAPPEPNRLFVSVAAGEQPMTDGPMTRDQRTSARSRRMRLVGALGLVLLGAPGCSVDAGPITIPRTAVQQILVTEAIERALDGLEWPDLEGRSVVVRSGAPGVGYGSPSRSTDEGFLLRAAEVRVGRSGGRVVEEVADADYVLTLLAGALSLDRSRRLFGIEGTEGGFFPITFPMLAIYERLHEEGFAKTQIVVNDARSGGLIHTSGPATATTFYRTQTFLFVIRIRDTDTSRPNSYE